MPIHNAKKSCLDDLIKSVTDEIMIAKDDLCYRGEVDKSVNQLIELAGRAYLALGLEDKTIKVDADNYRFTLKIAFNKAVSYTHLTLPTIYSV